MSLYTKITEAVELADNEGQLDSDHHTRLVALLVDVAQLASCTEIAAAIGEIVGSAHTGPIRNRIEELASDICSECEGATPSQIEAEAGLIERFGEDRAQQIRDDRLTGDAV